MDYVYYFSVNSNAEKYCEEQAGATGRQDLTQVRWWSSGISPGGSDRSLWNSFAAESWVIPGLMKNRNSLIVIKVAEKVPERIYLTRRRARLLLLWSEE